MSSQIVVRKLGQNDVLCGNKRGKKFRCYGCGSFLEKGDVMVTVQNTKPWLKQIYFHKKCFNEEKACFNQKASGVRSLEGMKHGL